MLLALMGIGLTGSLTACALEVGGRGVNIRRKEAMSRLMIVIALLVGLSACHAGFGIGDNGQSPTYVAANAWEAAIAQASIGTIGTAVPTAH
jgi:hypothetical protein